MGQWRLNGCSKAQQVGLTVTFDSKGSHFVWPDFHELRQMNSERPSIQAAVEIVDILWPEFALVDDHVFFAWAAPDSVNLGQWHDRTQVESTLNHTHVLDLFSHDANLSEEPWWNQSHSDFLAACKFGVAWAQAIATKLAQEFPERCFLVYYTEQDNPIVRFHQGHPGEIPWLSAGDYPEEIAASSIIIHRVRGYNISSKADGHDRPPP
jgi:hypothetical protein